jgi:hypothetical protein
MSDIGGEMASGLGSPDYGSAAVVSFTPEQSHARLLELRDDQGDTLGFLLNLPDVRLFYTPGQIEELQRRAALPPAGRPLRDVLDEAKHRAAAR